MPGCFHPELRFEGWRKLAGGGRCPVLPKGERGKCNNNQCSFESSLTDQPQITLLSFYVFTVVDEITHSDMTDAATTHVLQFHMLKIVTSVFFLFVLVILFNQSVIL